MLPDNIRLEAHDSWQAPRSPARGHRAPQALRDLVCPRRRSNSDDRWSVTHAQSLRTGPLHCRGRTLYCQRQPNRAGHLPGPDRWSPGIGGETPNISRPKYQGPALVWPCAPLMRVLCAVHCASVGSQIVDAMHPTEEPSGPLALGIREQKIHLRRLLLFLEGASAFSAHEDRREIRPAYAGASKPIIDSSRTPREHDAGTTLLHPPCTIRPTSPIKYPQEPSAPIEIPYVDHSVRRKRQRLTSNDPIETVPEEDPATGRPGRAGTVPIGT